MVELSPQIGQPFPPSTITRANVVTGLPSLVLIMIAGHISAKPSGNFDEQDLLLLTGPGGYRAFYKATQGRG